MPHNKSRGPIPQFFKKRPWHWCFLVNFEKKSQEQLFYRTHEYSYSYTLIPKNSFPYLYSFKTHSVALCDGGAENGSDQK